MKRALVALGALPALFLVGCDGDSGGSAATVKGVEYAFEMPDQVEGGLVKMNFENAGAVGHEFALGKINQGKTVEDLQRYLERPGGSEVPPWAEDLGGVATMSPGTRIGITRNLEPGTYAFLCFLPTPGGKTHLELGMFKGFEVSGDTGDETPATDGTIAATDEAFEVSELNAGSQTIELRNDAKKPTGFNLFALAPGLNPEDLERELTRWFRSGLKGEAPATFYGITQFIPPGESQYLDIDLKSGQRYMIIDPEAGLQEVFEVG